MDSSEIERQTRLIDQLSNAMDKLAGQITALGIGVSVKLGRASDRLEKAVDAATDRMSKAVDKASERHARSLVHATWALVFATIALVVVTAIYVYVAWTAGSG